MGQSKLLFFSLLFALTWFEENIFFQNFLNYYSSCKCGPKNHDFFSHLSCCITAWRTFSYIKIDMFVSWKATLNKQGTKIFNFTKMMIKNVNALHECKEYRNVDGLLRGSMIGEFIDDENKNSIRNPLYIEELQNTIEKYIEKITIQNNTTQHK
jgi:hypothetical protein